MAVHKRAYRPYDGPLTAERWRFLVLPRYAFLELFESRVLLSFVVLCFVPSLIAALGIYVNNSLPARVLLQISGDPAPLRREFFVALTVVQGVLCFMLTAWVAPVLVSPDLVNGALPLYLSRPFSRAEYVLGKAMVMVILLSAISWVPGVILFFLQGGLSDGWMWANLRVLGGTVAGLGIWISVLTLLGLALSAAIKWRLVASAAVLATFFVGAGFGEMWAEVLENSWGRLANLSYLIGIVWRDMYGVGEITAEQRARDLPLWAAWMGLFASCAVSLGILHRRLRAREVAS